MTGAERLSEGVRTLLGIARASMPIAGLGVVRHDGAAHYELTYADDLGATAYRMPIEHASRAFTPGGTDVEELPASVLEANVGGLVESRILQAGLPDRVRRDTTVRRVVTVPAGATALLIVALTDAGALQRDQIATVEALASRVIEFTTPQITADEELDLLRRLESMEKLLPGLFRVLDVREIFDRLSTITKGALRHDFATLGIISDDLEHIEAYAETADGSSDRQTGPMPVPAVQTRAWLYRFIDDLAANPLERDQPSAAAGGRTSIRVAVRLDDKLLGALNFTSRDPRPYGAADLVIARRLADYMALALSHQRLAEESRRAAALRERGANLEMLDGLLHTLTGVLDIREVFSRVSAIAQAVLPHDGLALTETIDNGERIRVHVSEGLGSRATPYDVSAAGIRLVTQPREFKIVADMTELDEYRSRPVVTENGMRAVLVAPIQVEGRHYGALVFYAKVPGRYTRDDALVGVRIADHVALAISHHRLAEHARRNEELRARAEKSDLIDEALASVLSSADLQHSFEHASNVVQKVLPHDALFLAVRLPDGDHARVYASRSSGPAFPDTVDVPPRLVENPQVGFDLVADLQREPDQQHLWTTKSGYRATLRMPMFLDDQFVGGLSWLSFTAGQYQQSDVPLARRITDRVALAFARERGALLLKRADEAAARASKLESRVKALTEELDARTGCRRVVGDSKSWRQVLTQATQVAATDTTVLLLGESGTGKEVVARFLHRASARNGGPFVALNCAALPEQLLEAELFGYERGAYTGATQSKPGQLEQAAGGTLFLDEVGEMSLPAQAKFLRVLQEREFQRLGGTRVLRTDARIVAATNRDLQKAIEQGQFREDLYYRLNVFAIRLPPLRERRDDILALSEVFLAEIGRGIGRPPAGISRDARQLLTEYHWPGNVRELRNILERAAILCEGGLITAEYLALAPPRAAVALASRAGGAVAVAASAPAAPAGPPTSAGDLQSLERGMIEQALQAARFNKSKAAKALGLTRQQLYVRMRKYGLE